MKLDSPWFDNIRSSSRRGRRGARMVPDACEWPGCACNGGFRAPKGRHQEGQYHNFCQEHARQYNQSYNYFADMPDEKVAEYQKSAYTGHRPTWTMGVKGERNRANFNTAESFDPAAENVQDPFGFFGSASRFRQQQAERERAEVQEIRKVARQAFEQLGLDANATPAQVKAQFKALAKRLHPDLNGGDRSTEDKLRAVIQAYNYLKANNYG